MSPILIFAGIIVLFILSGIKVINEYERGVTWYQVDYPTC